MFYVGIIYHTSGFIIRVRSEPFLCAYCDPVAFNEKHARVAVRRYIKGNLTRTLAAFVDSVKAEEAVTKRENLQQLMIAGKGPKGFAVDYGDCKK